MQGTRSAVRARQRPPIPAVESGCVHARNPVGGSSPSTPTDSSCGERLCSCKEQVGGSSPSTPTDSSCGERLCSCKEPGRRFESVNAHRFQLWRAAVFMQGTGSAVRVRQRPPIPAVESGCVHARKRSAVRVRQRPPIPAVESGCVHARNPVGGSSPSTPTDSSCGERLCSCKEPGRRFEPVNAHPENPPHLPRDLGIRVTNARCGKARGRYVRERVGIRPAGARFVRAVLPGQSGPHHAGQRPRSLHRPIDRGTSRRHRGTRQRRWHGDQSDASAAVGVAMNGDSLGPGIYPS